MPRRHRAGNGGAGAVLRIEEIVLASSGADAFELVFALAASRLVGPLSADRRVIAASIARACRAWPELGVARELDVPDAVLAEVVRLLDRALAGPVQVRTGPRRRTLLQGTSEDALGEALDAVFEGLVTRASKGQKGQFFTPRHVVELAIGALGLRAGERVVDPACGSGAFLAHARAHAAVDTWGADVDNRAVRVAKLLALATGADPRARVRADTLADDARWPARIDVIATNPPFAGDVRGGQFEVARLVRRAERDAFFLERAIGALRPGGRIAIVLPHGKVGASAWAPLRAWLVERARVYAVVSLPRETFMPHTSQRTALLFAKKRARLGRDAREKVLFAASERVGKNAAGDPVLCPGANGDDGRRALDHDFAEISRHLKRFFAKEGFA